MTPQIKQRIEQLRRGKVPEGYTKTKEGIIPSDWTIKKMKQWISIEERPVTLQDDEDYELVTVRRAYGGVDSRGIYKGKDVLVKTYFSVEKDDFIISKRQIAHGACGLVPEKLHGAVVSNEYNVFKANEGTNIHFFNLMMQLPHYKRLFYLMSDGVHIEKLLFKTGDWMKRSLAMPPLAEQKKIAEILSAQDKLIALKEKLIEEKKRQKKYLMQQLLTGKKRLPGFSGAWVTSKIKDVTEISAGATPDTNNPEFWGGNIKWMSSGELNNKHIYDVVGRITEIGLSKTSTKLLPQKCVLIGLAGQGKTRGTAAINYTELCTNQSIAAVHPCDIWVPEFLYYCLDMRYDELRLISSGDGTRGGLNLKLIGDLIIKYPSYEEQESIAKVLTTADKELEIFQKDLDQEKQKKKALMQLLLSGVVRV